MLIGAVRKLGDQRLVKRAYRLGRAISRGATGIPDPAALRLVENHY